MCCKVPRGRKSLLTLTGLRDPTSPVCALPRSPPSQRSSLSRQTRAIFPTNRRSTRWDAFDVIEHIVEDDAVLVEASAAR